MIQSTARTAKLKVTESRPTQAPREQNGRKIMTWQHFPYLERRVLVT